MTAELEKDWVKEVGEPAYSSIAEMVAALECDYDRLEELRDEKNEWEHADPGYVMTWADENADDAEELAELEAAAGECESQEDAQTRIQEDALDITVRGELRNGEWEADEFTVLLSTGGPAVRIKGELGAHGEPDRAWLEVQDWFKPWTQYFPADQDTLLAYARQFVYVS